MADAIRDYVWTECDTGGSLQALGVKIVQRGSQMPTPRSGQDLSDILPAVLVQYLGPGSDAKTRPELEALETSLDWQFHVFRLLGDTDEMEVEILPLAEALAELFIQDKRFRALPGWAAADSAAVGVAIRKAWASPPRLEQVEAIDEYPVEHMTFDLRVEANSYNV